MSSRIATIEVFPEYDADGIVDYSMPFTYGCPSLDLMGYSDINHLIDDIRIVLLEDDKI